MLFNLDVGSLNIHFDVYVTVKLDVEQKLKAAKKRKRRKRRKRRKKKKKKEAPLAGAPKGRPEGRRSARRSPHARSLALKTCIQISYIMHFINLLMSRKVM